MYITAITVLYYMPIKLIGLFSKIEGYQASGNTYWSGAFKFDVVISTKLKFWIFSSLLREPIPMLCWFGSGL